MTLWPFLLISPLQSENDPIFLNHEKIHAAQQKELLLIFFYLWYMVDYLKLRLKHSHYIAYRKIVFEREAYEYEHDLGYLVKRKPYGFLDYRTYRK